MNEQNKHAALTIAQQYPPTQYNLLVPMQTVTEIADIQKPVMNSVKISTDLNDGEIYEMEKAKDEWRDSKGYVHKATPAKYALTKKGLTKLMRAAGIKILSSRPVVPSTCQKCAEVNRSIGKPIRCGGCPNKDVKHEVRISVPQLTGENVTIVAHKEIAVEDVTAGMTEKQRAEFMKFRSEMCESKALNRALRTAMQIKSSYLIEEFGKPFVVAYLVPNLDNPTVREEAVKSMFGAANDLYGSRPKTSHTVYVDDDDDGYVQPEPDFEVVPEQPQQEQPPERPAQRPRQQQPAPSNRQQGRNGDSEFCADCGKQVGLDVAEYREFETIRLGEDDVRAMLSAERVVVPDRLKGKIVRVLYTCSDETNKAFNKAVLEKRLYDGGVFYVSEITPEEITTSVNRDELHGDNSPEQNLAEYLAEKEKSPEDAQRIIELARPIISEAMEKGRLETPTGVFMPVEIEVKNYRNYRDELFS